MHHATLARGSLGVPACCGVAPPPYPAGKACKSPRRRQQHQQSSPVHAQPRQIPTGRMQQRSWLCCMCVPYDIICMRADAGCGFVHAPPCAASTCCMHACMHAHLVGHVIHQLYDTHVRWAGQHLPQQLVAPAASGSSSSLVSNLADNNNDAATAPAQNTAAAQQPITCPAPPSPAAGSPTAQAALGCRRGLLLLFPVVGRPCPRSMMPTTMPARRYEVGGMAETATGTVAAPLMLPRPRIGLPFGGAPRPRPLLHRARPQPTS